MPITDYHRKILDLLEKHRLSNPDQPFTYGLREKNLENRSRHLYRFPGDDNSYIYVGMYRPHNGNNKTRSIGLRVGYNANQDAIANVALLIAIDDPKLEPDWPIYEEILETIGREKFREIRHKRYRYDYHFADWQESFRHFLTIEKPLIDEIINRHGKQQEFYIPPSTFEANLRIAPTESRDDLPNYWVFQGSPDKFRLVDALRDEALKSWRVTAHAQRIKVGDKVILWASGKNSGCYALVEVASAPYTGFDGETGAYYQTAQHDQTPSLRVKLSILHNFWNRPIKKADIQGLSEFNDFKGGSQGTNFTATSQQFEKLLELSAKENQLEPYLNYPKNIILYGPPGTGKTYETIDMAVEITDGTKSPDHRRNKQRFDALLGDQIEFITFHQNYSYEDFVMGLKPDLDDTGTGLKFRQHEGIFYQIAKRARLNYEASQTDPASTIQRSFEEVLAELARPLIENDQEVEITMSSGLGFVLTDIGERSIDFRKPNGSTLHTLSIATLKRIYEGIQDVSPNGLRSYYKPLSDRLKELGRTAQSKPTLKNYVLIIDEINRANMSRVFGELITLLEDDKRLGGENEIRLTLPSGERFGVPPNLYLIGTMNTADKSLALLDIALRRRFEFVGKYPQYDIKELDEEVSQLLQRLNEAIHKHKHSADFLIGHAYFIGKQRGALKPVFQNRVIPLLIEYFSGRTDLVETLLREADITTTKHPLTFQLEVADDF